MKIDPKNFRVREGSDVDLDKWPTKVAPVYKSKKQYHEMLEDHVEQSIRRNLDLLDRHKNLADFIEALKTMDRSRQDPLGRSPLLHMEMILFVARAEKRRPEVA